MLSLSPVTVWFVVISMLLSGLSVLCTIVVMNINHHGAHIGVPHWAKVFFLQKVAACLCIRHQQFMDDESTSVDKSEEDGANNYQAEKEASVEGKQTLCWLLEKKLLNIDLIQTF